MKTWQKQVANGLRLRQKERAFNMKYDRIYNFSAGPSMLPEPVLEEIRDEFMNYKGSGMNVMEMSHRSKVFINIYEEAES